MTWIEAGKKLFAENGINGLKVELLAKKVGISKSSFYHHFADMEVFIDRLLEHHVNQYKIISEKERQCNCLNPDLINILLEFKIDLLFNRQLRVNRRDRRFARCLEKTNSIVGPSFVKVWKTDLTIPLPSKDFDKLFSLVRESFYLQISNDSLNETWLSNYFSSVKEAVTAVILSAKPA